MDTLLNVDVDSLCWYPEGGVGPLGTCGAVGPTSFTFCDTGASSQTNPVSSVLWKTKTADWSQGLDLFGDT